MFNSCNNCGNDRFVDFLKLPVAGTTDAYQASAFRCNGENLVKCKVCGLVFVHPMPDSNAVLNGYAGAIDEKYVSQMPLRIKTFEKCMDKVEDVTGLKSGKILDVGAAAGAFVKVAQNRGWDAEGIEPCGYLVRWGIETLNLSTLHTGTLDDLEQGKRYDVVTMFDVIEHMADPNAAMYLVSHLLKDYGYLVVNIPDISTIIPRMMKSRWPFYASCHLYYYTPKTLDFLMHKHGFVRLYRGAHWQELTLGYLAYRFEQFNPGISRMMVKMIDKLGLSDVSIKYWIGQTLLVYKKV